MPASVRYVRKGRLQLTVHGMLRNVILNVRVNEPAQSVPVRPALTSVDTVTWLCVRHVEGVGMSANRVQADRNSSTSESVA